LEGDGLPRRLLTTFEVAEFVGCHEETVRRAYLRGLLVSQRFGVRCRRFRRDDVLDWIRRGAPTKARLRAERFGGSAITEGEGGS
jgi:excisionase family DNA binding protein